MVEVVQIKAMDYFFVLVQKVLQVIIYYIYNKPRSRLFVFLGSDCSIPHCIKDSCFNGGICSIENNSLQCQCPCGFTGKIFVLFKKNQFSVNEGSRCETPFDQCSLTICQNNGTRFMNLTKCQCSCICPSVFSGNLCQFPIKPINRTYPGQIVIPVNRLGGKKIYQYCFLGKILNKFFRIILGKYFTMY
jgi:hypothetical protein